jgi:phosphosulfolactate synthase (CoM biosynthesis protein A)
MDYPLTNTPDLIITPMNYPLSNLPDRTAKPRSSGITMMMDKGLSLRQVEDFLEVAGPYTDIVKLGPLPMLLLILMKS